MGENIAASFSWRLWKKKYWRFEKLFPKFKLLQLHFCLVFGLLERDYLQKFLCFRLYLLNPINRYHMIIKGDTCNIAASYRTVVSIKTQNRRFRKKLYKNFSYKSISIWSFWTRFSTIVSLFPSLFTQSDKHITNICIELWYRGIL